MVEVESVSAGGCELAGGEFGGGGGVERGVVRNVGAVAGVDVQGPVRVQGELDAVGVEEGVLPRADQDQVPQPWIVIPTRGLVEVPRRSLTAFPRLPGTARTQPARARETNC